jgi:hypothetical protein
MQKEKVYNGRVQLLAGNCKIADHTYRISGPTTTVHLSLGLRVTRLLALAVVTVERDSVSHSTLRNSMLTLSTQHCFVTSHNISL